MALEPLGIAAVAAGVPGFVRDMGKMDKGIQKVGKSATEVGTDFANLGKNVLKFGALISGAALGAMTAVGAGIVKLAVDAAPLEGITESFNNLSEAAETNGPVMLAALQKGAAGLATNRDLMTSFNKAAALVGNDFAVQLPDAMQFLGRVAQATGQDLGFLLDSLVVGVGRLSPMILDNLGIQVALSDATAKAAEMFGVQESELTKTQQQAGLMAVVMEKLEVSTAALPDVAGSASQAFGQFGIMLQNFKDEVGLALIPTFKNLAGAIAPLLEELLPRLVSIFQERVIPILDGVVNGLLEFISDMKAGLAPIDSMGRALSNFLPRDLAARIANFTEGVIEDFQKMADFVVENKDIIISAIKGIGLALAGAAIFAILLKVLSILGLIASPIGLIVLAVSALKLAWDTNFLGIRDTLTEFWENTAKPVLEDIREWLEEKLPPVIDAVKGFFEDLFGGEGQSLLEGFGEKIQPLIDRFEPFITTLIEAFGELKDGLAESLPVVLDAFAQIGAFIQNTLAPIFGVAFEFILRTVENVITIVTKLVRGLTTFWKKNGTTIIRVVQSAFKGILGIVTGVISLITGIISGFTALLAGDFEQAFENILGGIGGFFQSILGIVDTNLSEFLGMWSGIFDNLGTIVSTALQNVITGILDFGSDLLSALEDSVVGQAVGGLLDLLGVDSPSKLMAGVGAEMMAGLAAGIASGAGLPTLALSGVGATTVPATAQNIEMKFEQNISTRAETEPVAADFQQMVAQAESVSRRF